MAFNLVTAVPFGGTWLTSALPSTWSYNQTFTVASTAGWREVAADGSQTQIPIGQSGPFLIELEGEGILCSSVVGNTVLVYQDGASNGRGYTGSAVAHKTGVQTKPNLTIVGTSAQVTGAISQNVVSQTLVANAVTVAVTTSSASLTNNSSATATITLATTGAVDGQFLTVRFYDFAATAESLTWTNTENGGASVPTTSNGSVTLPKTVQFIFNGATSKWRCILSA